MLKLILRIGGGFFLTLGMVWIVAVARGVASHAEGFRTLDELWGALAFHAVTMAVGAFLWSLTLSANRIAEPAQG